MTKRQFTHVYIDESGDLGRSANSSRFVVVTAIATDEPRRLEKIVRKVWTTKQHKKDAGELHAMDASDAVRLKLLTLLDEMSVQVTYTVIDKVAFADDLHQEYYRALAAQVARYRGASIIVIDKRDTNTKRAAMLRSLGLETQFADVEFADSRTARHSQAVDFASWSIYQHLENKDEQYVDVFRRRIVGALK